MWRGNANYRELKSIVTTLFGLSHGSIDVGSPRVGERGAEARDL